MPFASSPLSLPPGDGSRTATFWGYVLTPYLTISVGSMVESGRLALVFDLDETLLVANSTSTLDSKIEVCRKSRYELMMKHTRVRLGVWLIFASMLLLVLQSHSGKGARFTWSRCD